MEIDDDGPAIRRKMGKRKVCCPIDTDSLDDDLSEASRMAPMRTRAARKKRATAEIHDSGNFKAGPDATLWLQERHLHHLQSRKMHRRDQMWIDNGEKLEDPGAKRRL